MRHHRDVPMTYPPSIRSAGLCSGVLGVKVGILEPSIYTFYPYRDPHTFSESTWALQAYIINSLQSPSQKVLGSLGYIL